MSFPETMMNSSHYRPAKNESEKPAEKPGWIRCVRPAFPLTGPMAVVDDLLATSRWEDPFQGHGSLVPDWNISEPPEL